MDSGEHDLSTLWDDLKVLEVVEELERPLPAWAPEHALLAARMTLLSKAVAYLLLAQHNAEQRDEWSPLC